MANTIQNIRRTERRDPIRALQREMEQVFDQFSYPMPLGMNMNMMAPALDITETDDAYLVSIDVPGMNQADIKIELDDHQLRVSGERKEERSERDRTARSERYFGWFERVVTLPSQVRDEQIEATLRNGVLHIAVPKVEAVQPKQIPISHEKSGGILSRLLGKSKESESQPQRPAKTG